MLRDALRFIGAARAARRARLDPIGYARSIGVKVGRDCRLIGVTPETFGSEPYLIRLGDHVTVTAGVRFVTHDGGVWVFRDEHPNIDVFDTITIGNNVFLGLGTIVLPGVTIGDDCVIGAGSVVKSDVPAATVAAGTPAKPIRSLAEYRERVMRSAMFVRDLPEPEKRKLLERRFWLAEAHAPEPVCEGVA